MPGVVTNSRSRPSSLKKPSSRATRTGRSCTAFITATWGFVATWAMAPPARVRFQSKHTRNAKATARAPNAAMHNAPPAAAGDILFQREETRVLVVNADPALRGLIEEWLAGEACRFVEERPDLVLVDLPFPREHGAAMLARIAQVHPHVPVVALSSNFFPGIESNGAIARALG